MMVYKNDKSLLNTASTLSMSVTLALAILFLASGTVTLGLHFLPFHIGDKVRMNIDNDLFGKVGVINGTYEYNNYNEKNTHTGYRVAVNGTNYTFDKPDFDHTLLGR